MPSLNHKTVFDGCAFLDAQRLWREQTTGTTASTNSLLVIPQGAGGHTFIHSKEFGELPDKTGYWTARSGDRAFQGVGPDIATSTEWTNLTPAKASGVIQISNVDVKRNLAGEIVHIEAGG